MVNFHSYITCINQMKNLVSCLSQFTVQCHTNADVLYIVFSQRIDHCVQSSNLSDLRRFIHIRTLKLEHPLKIGHSLLTFEAKNWLWCSKGVTIIHPSWKMKSAWLIASHWCSLLPSWVLKNIYDKYSNCKKHRATYFWLHWSIVFSLSVELSHSKRVLATQSRYYVRS